MTDGSPALTREKQTRPTETKQTILSDIVSVLSGHDVRSLDSSLEHVAWKHIAKMRTKTDMLSGYSVSLVAGQKVQSAVDDRAVVPGARESGNFERERMRDAPVVLHRSACSSG